MSRFGEYTMNMQEVESTMRPSASTALNNQTNNPNSVNGKDIKGGNVDIATFGNTTAPSISVANSNNRGILQIQKSIETTCQRNKINHSRLMKIIYEITGKTQADFKAMDENIQKSLLLYVEDAIALAERAPENVDKLEAVKAEVELIWSAISDKTFADREEIETFENKVANSEEARDIRQNSSKLSLAEIKAKKEKVDTQLQEQFKHEEALIDKLPQNQRAQARQLLRAKHRFIRNKMYTETMISTDSEKGLAMMSIVHSADLGNAAAALLSTRVDDTEREKVASKQHQYTHFTECVEAAQARGEDITSEEALQSFEKYNTEFVSWKDMDSAVSYQYKASVARRNGNLPEEVYKAAAKGIGVGAYANHVMDTIEKEAFIKCWMHNNEGFLSDKEMSEVEQAAKTYIQQYHAKHSDTKCAQVREGKILAQEVLKRPFNTENINVNYISSTTGANDLKSVASLTSGTVSETSIEAKKVEKLLKEGKTIAEICSKNKKAVQYVLNHPQYSKKFLSDNNMIAKYAQDIKLYIQSNLKNKDDKIAFVESNPKTLNIMVSCLNNDEKREFASAMEGKLSYTVYKATFKESNV